ncbi:MAG: DMT family transporter [Bacteroidia bacterium]|nr:DMT family transporter [Bacteroidia bacterium]
MKNFFTPGVKLMLIASVGFACMNASVKYISHIPVFEVILFRSIITLLISYITLKKRKVNPWGTHHKFLIARGLFGAGGLICYFYTLQHLQLANAIVIHYLSPIFTTLIAMLFLKERVKGIQWLAFGISFTGVILVKGFANISLLDFLVGVLGAALSGFAYNAIRNMRDKEDADVIIFYHPLISLPVVLIYLLLFPQSRVIPTAYDWIFLIGTGIFTQVGQYYITRAYQMDTAARISSVSYIGIIWGVLMGKYLFNDTYPATVLIGMLIVLSGVMLNLNALRLRKLADKIRNILVRN